MSAGASRALVLLATALAAWVIGALPWITEGLRLGLSSAWPSVLPDSTVRVALPVGEYRLLALGTAGALGVTAAVLLARALRRPAWVGALGGALGMVVAGLQTAYVLHPLLTGRREAVLLAAGMIAVWLLGTLLGLVLGLGLGDPAGRRTTWAALCGAVVVVLGQGWLLDLTVRGAADTAVEEIVVRQALPILALLLGVALAWAGWGTPPVSPALVAVRWLLVVGVFWVLTAVVTAAQYGAGYARNSPLPEAARAAREVAVLALRPEAYDLVWVLGGGAVGLAVLLVRRTLRRAAVVGVGGTGQAGTRWPPAERTP